jgi:hypothetical protein
VRCATRGFRAAASRSSFGVSSVVTAATIRSVPRSDSEADDIVLANPLRRREVDPGVERPSVDGLDDDDA